eukprot:scaffold460_cov81-Skeletonema_menzelii.AAC.9
MIVDNIVMTVQLTLVPLHLFTQQTITEQSRESEDSRTWKVEVECQLGGIFETGIFVTSSFACMVGSGGPARSPASPPTQAPTRPLSSFHIVCCIIVRRSSLLPLMTRLAIGK